ncbi:cell division protein FtsA [Vermiphilus pyriformis]|nr:MAG: cell division protein FtsA [Vermiphilus pyriformis]
MAKIFSDRIITAIDIGTTKVCVLVAQVIDKHNFEIIGFGKATSEGIRKGAVVDIGKTVHAIKSALKEAELMIEQKLEWGVIGIADSLIQSVNSHGVVPIKHGQVTHHEIAQVLASARATVIPEGFQILHVIPQYYTIDGHDKVLDPLGMCGVRLEVQAHIIMGAVSCVQNLINCCQQAGIKVIDIVLEQLASSEAVLSPDEKELGVAVLDIGGGTSDLAVYQHGSLRYTKVIPIAGSHFTNDLALGLHTTLKDAERVKKEYGLKCYESAAKDYIEVQAVHGAGVHQVPTHLVRHIINARAQEFVDMVHKEMVERNLKSIMASGIVLTGGGSLLAAFDELINISLEVPVRIGTPAIVATIPQTLKHPMYATAYGLLKYALRRVHGMPSDEMGGPLVKRVLGKMKSWFFDFF